MFLPEKCSTALEIYCRLSRAFLAQDARQASSEEARLDLESAHRRIAAVASVQRHLDASRHAGQIHLASYLTELCQTLARSAVDDRHPITIEVRADGVRVPSAMAVNIGLVVAELVINVIKHAFPSGRAGGRIVVSYRSDGDDWRLTVSDNGVGMPVGGDVSTKASLGTGIVAALVRRLGASIKTSAGLGGVGASVTVSASSVSPAQGSATSGPACGPGNSVRLVPVVPCDEKHGLSGWKTETVLELAQPDDQRGSRVRG